MPFLVLSPDLAQDAPAVDFGAPDGAGLHPTGKSLSQIRNRVILEIGNRTDIPNQFYNEWINDSYKDLWESLNLHEAKKSFQIGLTANQMMYNLPQTVSSIRNLSWEDDSVSPATTGKDLEEIDLYTFRKLPIRTGRPTMWFKEQYMLVLWPTPLLVYTLAVDCVINPQLLVNDTDYPIMEDKWHESLFLGAKERAWTAVQNDMKAVLTENKQARLVGRKGDEGTSGSGVYNRLRPVSSSAELTALRKGGLR